MEDKITEKVYCYDHPRVYNNHNALSIAAMCNRLTPTLWLMMAAQNGGMDGS